MVRIEKEISDILSALFIDMIVSSRLNYSSLSIHHMFCEKYNLLKVDISLGWYTKTKEEQVALRLKL